MLAFLRYMRAMDLELLLDLEHDVQTHARRLVEYAQVSLLRLFPGDLPRDTFVMSAAGLEPIPGTGFSAGILVPGISRGFPRDSQGYICHEFCWFGTSRVSSRPFFAEI
jgi:hypothetical protein